MSKFRGAALAAILAAATAPATLPASASAQVAVGISVGAPPPPLPIYDQPPIPGPGYIWTPGYWAWDYPGYYWVPGTWVLAPEPGFLWTPAWWGWDDGVFIFHTGYWGPFVGFYGGIDYGFGYPGFGYFGGRWDHDRFFYNRSVNNFGGARIANSFNGPAARSGFSRVSYNGGVGGTRARPTAAQIASIHQFHTNATPAQVMHQRTAAASPMLRATANHGAPPVAATRQAAVLRGPGVVPSAHSISRANLSQGMRPSTSLSGGGTTGHPSNHATPFALAPSRFAASRPAPAHLGSAHLASAQAHAGPVAPAHGGPARQSARAFAFNGRESARASFAAPRPSPGGGGMARFGGREGGHMAPPQRGGGGGGRPGGDGAGRGR